MSENPHVGRATFMTSAVAPEGYPESPLPEIAVAGRSNVGKSTLINKLVNRRRLAKVSNTPGRTQLLNFFQVDDAFTLCDLPGYGYAKVPKAVKARWGRMIENYLIQRQQLKAVLILIDVRRDVGDWERNLVGWVTANGRVAVPVITKIDKLPKSKRKLKLQELARQLGIPYRRLVGWSALSGEGLVPLWNAVMRQVQPAPSMFPVEAEASEAEAAPATDAPQVDAPASPE